MRQKYMYCRKLIVCYMDVLFGHSGTVHTTLPAHPHLGRSEECSALSTSSSTCLPAGSSLRGRGRCGGSGRWVGREEERWWVIFSSTFCLFLSLRDLSFFFFFDLRSARQKGGSLSCRYSILYIHVHVHVVVVDFSLLYSVWFFFVSSLFSFSLWCTMHVIVHVRRCIREVD